jgi:hypothetical protein
VLKERGEISKIIELGAFSNHYCSTKIFDLFEDYKELKIFQKMCCFLQLKAS